MDRMLEATKRIKAASIIVRRLMPENRSGRTGAATETASAKTLTQRPAVETVTSKRSAICGMMPTTPISVLMMPKTPSVRMVIRSDSEMVLVCIEKTQARTPCIRLETDGCKAFGGEKRGTPSD